MAMLETRLTRLLGIRHPVLSAPMAFAAGGALAGAVSAAGGLGLLGGGYGEADWLTREFGAAGNQRIGCGFITWSLAKNPALLEQALAHRPAAVMLSFGDSPPCAKQVKDSGAKLICQVQDMAHVRAAIAAGADIIAAQGGEAGGHGAARGTLTLVPEVADLLAQRAPDVVLVAAGGIADGRGLAAALMLGAEGALIGTRFWASREALVAPRHHAAALAADGDGTVRQTATDVARGLDWPREFSARILRNEFTRRFAGREDALRADLAAYGPAYAAAVAAGDPDKAGVWAGEAAGMIAEILPAGEIVAAMMRQTAAALARWQV